MTRTNLITIASICLTVQSARSPGDGCCQDVSGGFSSSLREPRSLRFDDRIPEGAQCDLDWSGTQAVSAAGDVIQDVSVNCVVQDGITNYRSVGLSTASTNLGARITTHPNGTIEADCNFDSKLTGRAGTLCVGPKYHACFEFVGIVTYGSLKAERYSCLEYNSKDQKQSDGFIDLDVENGCIPIWQEAFMITNYVASDPAQSVFAIPQECFQPTNPTTLPTTTFPGLPDTAAVQAAQSVTAVASQLV